MKKYLTVVFLSFFLFGCFDVSKTIPEGLAPPKTQSTESMQDEIMLIEQAKIIAEGTRRRDRKRAHMVFIEGYKILKTLPVPDKTPYLEALLTAKNIPEISILWTKLDQEMKIKSHPVETIKKIEDLEKNCQKINFCKDNADLGIFLSQLKEGVENQVSSEELSEKFSSFTQAYFNETNKDEILPQSPAELAQAITKNYFESSLKQKKMIEIICPVVMEGFNTSEEYNSVCGNKSMKKFEAYKQKVEAEENLDLENRLCAEFMVVLKRSTCEEVDREYVLFRESFLK